MFTQCGLNSERTFKENVGLFREKNAKRDRPFHDNASEQEERGGGGGGEEREREKKEKKPTRVKTRGGGSLMFQSVSKFSFSPDRGWGGGEGGMIYRNDSSPLPPPPSLLPFDRSNAADSLNNARGAGVVWEGGRREEVGGS